MLLALVVLCLSHSSIVAAPTDTHTTSSWTIAQQMSTSQLSCPEQQRTLWDIVKSCLVTIFACSWVSVHPNIPPPNDKWWMGPLRRLELMAWAIIAPEVIILWAMRQWMGARRLANENQELGWTKAHGHFYQMGGFRDWKNPSECPRMTEKEILNFSKADALSKALVIFQTLWFVTQCIVRRVEGLYITELELATAAFAVLNGVMYFLWWNKPLGVQCSVPVQSFGKPLVETGKAQSQGQSSKISVSAVFFGVFRRLFEIGSSDDRQGSAFYAYTSDYDDGLAAAWASVAAMIFGGIHCAGWVFHFPSHIELIIWRVSSVVITSLPLYMFIIFLVSDEFLRELPYSLGDTFKYLALGGIPFYIIARLLLLVEAFTTLRVLPPGAYEVVRWTTFIPHV